MSVPGPPRSPRRALGRFFGVVLEPRTYKNVAYLSLTFPLGMAYFVTLVVLFSMGVALSFILVGIPIVLVAVLLVHELTAVERWQAQHLLGADAPTLEEEPAADWKTRFRRVFLSLPTWRGFVYLMSKFFVGLLVLVLYTVPLSVLGGLLVAPVHFLLTGERLQFVSVPEPITYAPSIVYEVEAFRIALTVPFQVTDWYIDSPLGALLVLLFGVLASVVVLHLTNLFGRVLAWYADRLLGNTRPSLTVRLIRYLEES